VEDYFNLVSDLILACPREFLRSSLLPAVFNAMLASFSLKEQYALASVFRYCRIVLDHANDIQFPRSPPSPPCRISEAEAAIAKGVFVEHGAVFMTQILQGIMFTFPPDVVGDATGLLKALTLFCPQESLVWYGKAVSTLEISPAELQKAVADYTAAVSEGNWSKVRSAIQNFTTLYRRKYVIPRNRGKK
ncbi:Nuclear import receptor, partial [Lunasporangiospora selenospora]